MIYPRNQTTRNMAALLRKLKRRRRVPTKRCWQANGRWRCWRDELKNSAKNWR